MNNTYLISAILVMSVVTLILRVLPFLIFGRKNYKSKYITYLGNTLPYAIIGMLVVYCLKEVNLLNYGKSLPEIISILVIGVVHIWKRNTLISILLGTILYMFLVQVMF